MDSLSNAALIRKGEASSPLDARNLAKWIIGLAILGTLLFFLLPILVTIAWNLVNLAVAGGILFLMIITIGNKNFRRRCGYFVEAISKILLGWAIEFDEFVIQEQQINQAEKDVEKLLAEKEKIEGKYVQLSSEVQQKKQDIVEKTRMAQIASKAGEEEDADTATRDIVNDQEYIKSIEPIVGDMKTIVDFSGNIYKVLRRKIKNAKQDLAATKDRYYAAQSGASALDSAKKAIFGNPNLNNDADIARQKVKEKTALFIGQMRSSMEILTQVSNMENLKDKAKMQLAREQIQQLNSSSDDGSVQVPLQSSFAGLTPENKYKGLL